MEHLSGNCGGIRDKVSWCVFVTGDDGKQNLSFFRYDYQGGLANFAPHDPIDRALLNVSSQFN